MLVRPVLRGHLAHHIHLLRVARPEDDPAHAPAVPVGGGLALRRLIRLRRLEGVSQRLAGLRHPGSRVHIRQQQLVLLDHGHRRLPVRVHRQEHPKSCRQHGVVFPSCQVRGRRLVRIGATLLQLKETKTNKLEATTEFGAKGREVYDASARCRDFFLTAKHPGKANGSVLNPN